MQLTATFPKTADGRNLAEYRWHDGLVATTPGGGRPGSLPHDLGHYIVEAQVDVPYGFWALASRQAPFKSLTVVHGRWPRAKVEWWERVKRKHPGALVQAEALGVVSSLAEDKLDIHRDWARIRRGLTRAYAYEEPGPLAKLTQQQLLELVPFHHVVHKAWEAVPLGGALEVTFPRLSDPTVVPATGR